MVMSERQVLNICFSLNLLANEKWEDAEETDIAQFGVNLDERDFLLHEIWTFIVVLKKIVSQRVLEFCEKLLVFLAV